MQSQEMKICHRAHHHLCLPHMPPCSFLPSSFLCLPSPSSPFLPLPTPLLRYFTFLISTSLYLYPWAWLSPVSDMVSSKSWKNGCCQKQNPILKFMMQKEKKPLDPQIGSLRRGRACLSQVFTICIHLWGQATDTRQCAREKTLQDSPVRTRWGCQAQSPWIRTDRDNRYPLKVPTVCRSHRCSVLPLTNKNF